MSGRISILHITPHLGGGVGRVLLNYLLATRGNPAVSQTIACLDYANDQALRCAADNGLQLTERMAGKKQELASLIAGADIVLVHWWNHPLLYDLLVRETLPPCRMAFWSHISGFHPPYVFSEKALAYPDLFVFTTPVSYEAPEVKNLADRQKERLRDIWSTGGIEHVRSVAARPHAGFTVGYIGTVDYCKLHPDFLTLCSRVRIPDLRFIVCGGPQEKKLALEAAQLGMGSTMQFTGLVPDITQYLPLFDVFGYPLAPYHYGTCDQVLAESMAAGVVPVVLGNRMERVMVRHNATGLVAGDTAEYVHALEALFHNAELRQTLSCNARAYALETFSLAAMSRAWEGVYDELLPLPKTAKKWPINKSKAAMTAKDVFLESLGSYGEVFCAFCDAATDAERAQQLERIRELARSPLWQAQTRGTVYHYQAFFPGDAYLSAWADAMSQQRHAEEGIAAACANGQGQII